MGSHIEKGVRCVDLSRSQCNISGVSGGDSIDAGSDGEGEGEPGFSAHVGC